MRLLKLADLGAIGTAPEPWPVQTRATFHKTWINNSRQTLPRPTARELGATWDGENLAFFTSLDDAERFAKYIPKRQANGRYSDSKTKLFAPPAEKQRLRALGGKFDPETASWYAPPGLELNQFQDWLEDRPVVLFVPFQDNGKAKLFPGVKFNPNTKQWTALLSNTLAIAEWGSDTGFKVFLNVPFGDNAEVKKLGARFDSEAMRFYVDLHKLSRNLFTKWLPREEEENQEMRCFLNVPFEEKDEVKQLGARFDAEQRKWYFNPNVLDYSMFVKWPVVQPSLDLGNNLPNKQYLNVPFGDKDEAKDLGARFDGDKRKWYFDTKVFNPSAFAKWELVSPITVPIKPHYLNVPFEDKNEAKLLGAKFDGDKRKWYFDENAMDRQVFAKWTSVVHSVFLTVPLSDKHVVEQLGAKFDLNKRKWYFDSQVIDCALFARWIPVHFPTSTAVALETANSAVQMTANSAVQVTTNSAVTTSTETPTSERILLQVPFSESNEVRELGAQFCQATKKWFVIEDDGKSKQRFAKWLSRRKFVSAASKSPAQQQQPQQQQPQIAAVGRQ
ncbi:hypothetical protein BASA81_003914 [Batrachochytrium salamandrivorans]|nr:hypothetical protein BASA81_003914 [Batrachochytrium salamandrivorans]